MICNKRVIRTLILFIWLFCLPFPVYAQQPLSDHALIKALRLGGYNLYFRHEATEWSQRDVVHQKGDWLSCDGRKIRQLSEQGRQNAKRTGEAMRSLNIPVSEVLASPYCRTMETAHQLALGHVQASVDVINLRIAEYFGGKEAVIATARRLLARAPAAESNRVIVAHGNVAQAATPTYPEEGEMVIFQPDGKSNFTYVGRIANDQWFKLRQVN